ncbi:VOC family protein [Patescibacteria group bacterium]|nr:VOC family protein [Patescibacteria group bacterium]
MQKIVTNLWFDENAEEAVRYYTGIFKHCRILHTSYYGEAAAKRLGRTPGSVLVITFELEGQQFAAINGGPHFSFTPAISLVVNCETQAELDKIWKKLAAKGSVEQCGWLRDRFGVSWQVVPTRLQELMATPGEAANRVVAAMLDMKKLELDVLEAAYREAAQTTEMAFKEVPQRTLVTKTTQPEARPKRSPSTKEE